MIKEKIKEKGKIGEEVLPIIRKIRPMLLPYWGNIEVLRYKDGSGTNAVTKLDEKVEKYLEAELKKNDPTAGFFGEEFGGDINARKFWLVDPIDGTSHFIRGMPFCTTMIALIENGQVVFSAIYDFINDIIYHAEKGKGAYKNDVPIRVSKRPIEESYIAWETHLENPENMKIFLKLKDLIVPFKTVCSGYEYILVATGKIEGRVCFDGWGKEYDFAPGSLLVSEAGGVVTNIGKDIYDFRNLNYIAANKPVYEALTKGINSIFPRK